MPNVDRDARQAAEVLLSSGSQHSLQNVSPIIDVSNSHSINTAASTARQLLTEEMLQGHRPGGRMSNVRRFFCLFVTFDLLFTSLTWLICIMLSGDNITTALSKQIVHYNIQSSLFDIVLAAICRFTVLLLFYALIYIDHWIIISLSTAATCAFLIAKVFIFDWVHSTQSAFQVFLILTSFVLAWGEVWFLDFKVIPQELQASRFAEASFDERTPLIPPSNPILPSTYTESVGNFYSPLASPSPSLYGDDVRKRSASLTTEQVEGYRKKAHEALDEAWALLNSANWKSEKQTSSGDYIYSMKTPKRKKIYKLSGEINVPARFLHNELFYHVDDMPKWDATLSESRRVQIIDEATDITYQMTAKKANGPVRSRDFVTLRHWSIIDGCYITATVAAEYPQIPKTDKVIRGENGIGCFVMRPISGDMNRCVFQWVLNIDLKGWIPQYTLDLVLTDVMCDYIKSLRVYCSTLNRSSDEAVMQVHL